MEVKVLFDKESLEKEFKTGWGVSFLIDGRVLFDTGENGDWLSFNMQRMKVEVDRIVAVVISHHHWDHTGGLWELLNRKQGLRVYGCPHFDADFKRNVKRFKGEIEIIADKLQEMGVQKVGPTHCSGYEAQLILKEKYKHGYIQIKVGKTLRI